MNWNDSIWFFDIDDTLINTADQTQSASVAIKDVFTPVAGADKAEKVRKEFEQIFAALLNATHENPPPRRASTGESEHQIELLIERIKKYEEPVLQKFCRLKKWSREVMIKLAADNQGLDQIDGELIEAAAAAYWRLLEEGARVEEGALELVRTIRKMNRPVFLLTSSDARLKPRPDGLFEYDPRRSEQLKRKRMEGLKTKGVDTQGLMVGDPEDKPEPAFFEKGLRLAETVLGRTIAPGNCIVVGDSYEGDIKTPLETMNFGLGILLQRKTKAPPPKTPTVDRDRQLGEN